ncbi:ABC transporter ATP-binding protein [Haloarchaeobius sp. DFWS5]|uniref:ABC transporter ATP-binding protein n=1 Tax=Haloarchaeobius sp. DFWS5 TaxID=3446114 RepID=UPI003EC04995
MSRSEAALGTHERGQERDVIIEMNDVTVKFDMDRGESRVLDEVSMEIYREEILGVVGESGSGKSMFAAALLDAVVNPGIVTGDITYYPRDGDPVDVLNLRDDELKKLRWNEISMVFQGAMSSFNPTMKIKDHFEETIHAHRASYSERMDHAYRLISDLYMDPERVMNAYPHELSGGMKQRTLIALSLILEPEILVMDEPTAALDLLMQRTILTLLQDLQENYDLTVVFITHDLPLVAGLADRLGVMYAFNFVEYGPSADVVRDAGHPYTRALLRSVPSVDAPLDEMRPIEGEAPDPVNVPAGCSYHPRCPVAREQCVQSDPHFHEVEGQHEAACFYSEEAQQSVPYGLGAHAHRGGDT